MNQCEGYCLPGQSDNQSCQQYILKRRRSHTGLGLIDRDAQFLFSAFLESSFFIYFIVKKVTCFSVLLEQLYDIVKLTIFSSISADNLGSLNCRICDDPFQNVCQTARQTGLWRVSRIFAR